MLETWDLGHAVPAGRRMTIATGAKTMATRILPPATVRDMVSQLERLGGIVDWSDTGVVVKAPKNGREAFRAMHGTSGKMLARWPDGLFDQA